MAEKLQALISAVPEGVNPYLFVQDGLLRSFIPKTKSSFLISLKVNAVFLAVGFLVSLASLLAKLLQGRSSWWLYRIRSTPHGRLITPNATLLFLLSSFYFCATAEAWTWLMYETFEHQRLIAQMEALHGWTWLGMWFAVLIEAHCMACFLGATQSTTTRYIPPAWIVNLYFCAVPIAFFILHPILFTIAAHTFAAGVDKYEEIAAGLMQAATEWDGSSAFKLRIAWVPLLAEFAELLQHDYTVQMRRGYSNLFAFTLVATLTFIPAALLYMSTLRAQMRTAMPQSRIDSINGIGQTQQVAFLRDLKISYRLLILATCSFAFLGTGYCVLAAAPVVDFLSVFTTPRGIEIQMSMALYIYSFFGAPTMFVIAYKTWQSYNAPSLRQIFPAGSPSSTSKSRPMRQPAYTGLNAPPQSYAAMLRAVRVNTVVQVEVPKAEEELEMDDKGPARLRVGVLAPEDRALERVKEQMDAYFVPF